MVEFTTVVGVDEKHVKQLRWTWPTWELNFQSLLRAPLLLICDGQWSEQKWHEELSFLEHPNATFVMWNQSGVTQREKMLTALTLAPGDYVTTPWYLKLDTDALRTTRSRWPLEEWFEEDQEGNRPVFVSNPWGYTKPPDAIQRLDDWADGIPELSQYPRLNLVPKPGSNLVKHRRIISWSFFGNTAWTREVTKWCNGRLPVPSQDTYLWYCAARRRERYVRVRMKRYGWKHVSRARPLRIACRNVVKEFDRGRSDSTFQDAAAPTSDSNIAVGSRCRTTTTTSVPAKGLMYLLTGQSHAVRMVVSMVSLRKYYDGPVTVFTTHAESHLLGREMAADPRLNVEHRIFPRIYRRKNASFLLKIAILRDAPFEHTMYLDADTLVTGDISAMFDFSEEPQLIVTRFADWTSRTHRIRRRIKRWREISQQRYRPEEWQNLLHDALKKRPAINGGVLAVRRGAKLIERWHQLSLIGKRTFICDEIALQILYHKFPHKVLDCRWNCSPIYGVNRDSIRIWHMHGGKHLREQARQLWLPAYAECLKENFARIRDWTPAGDRRLQGFLESLNTDDHPNHSDLNTKTITESTLNARNSGRQ